MRKRIKLIIVSLVGCLLLAGNSPVYAEVWALGEREWYTHIAKPYRGTTITVIQEGAPGSLMVKNYKSEFEKATGIKVNLIYHNWGDAFKKQTADCASGRGKYDVLYVEGELKGAFASRGWLMPLKKLIYSSLQSPWLKWDDFVPEAVWATGVWPNDSPFRYRTAIGTLVAVPFDTGMQLLFYRRDLLDDPTEKANFAAKYGYELRVPKTWEEYTDIARFFTRESGETLAGETLTAPFYGTALEAQMGDPLSYDFLNWAFSFGGGYFDDNLDVIINSPEVAEALQYYKSLTKFSPPGTLSYNWLDNPQSIMQKRVFMALCWDEFGTMMDDPSTSRVVGKVGYAPPPVHPRNPVPTPIAHGSAAAISAFSENPEAAWLWIQWVTGSSLQTQLTRDGALLPPRISAYADPEVIKLSKGRANPQRMLPVKMKIFGTRAWRPRMVEWPEINEIVYTTLHPALTGEKTIAEVLQLAEEKLKALNVKESFQKEVQKFIKGQS